MDALVQRIDIDAIVEQTELGTIVARSTSGVATDALDAARSQTAGADTLVTRAVNRVLRRARRARPPLGPALLIGEVEAEVGRASPRPTAAVARAAGRGAAMTRSRVAPGHGAPGPLRRGASAACWPGAWTC